MISQHQRFAQKNGLTTLNIDGRQGQSVAPTCVLQYVCASVLIVQRTAVAQAVCPTTRLPFVVPLLPLRQSLHRLPEVRLVLYLILPLPLRALLRLLSPLLLLLP
jgi:hypothetical protein